MKYGAWLLSLPLAGRIAWLRVFTAIFSPSSVISGGIAAGLATFVISERQLRRDQQAAGRRLSRDEWERVLRSRRELKSTGDAALNAAAASGSRQAARMVARLAVPGAVLFGVVAGMFVIVAVADHDPATGALGFIFILVAAAYPWYARRLRKRDEQLRRANLDDERK